MRSTFDPIGGLLFSSAPIWGRGDGPATYVCGLRSQSATDSFTGLPVIGAIAAEPCPAGDREAQNSAAAPERRRRASVLSYKDEILPVVQFCLEKDEG